MSVQAQAEVPAAEHAMQCMEIWGGNQAVCNAVSVPGIDTWVYSLPHEGAEGGGDIHYVSMCAAGYIARFAVADVAGHGQDVELLSRQLRDLMRRNINTLDQTRMTRALNEAFGRISVSGRFATALLATYDTRTDHLIVCNAGHPRPLWFRAGTRTWQVLTHEAEEAAHSVANLPLGIIEPTEYTQFAVRLEPDDLVIAYTDALVEASGCDGRMLSEAGLLDLAQSIRVTDPMQYGNCLLNAVADYRGGAPADDDVTLLVLHHNAQDPPRQSLGERVRVTARMLGLRRV